MKRVLFAAAFVCAIAAAPAPADVIYDNGAPNLQSAWPSDTTAGVIQLDDFVLTVGSETISDIHWWGIYSNHQVVTDDFTILILGDNGGVPDPANVLLDLSAGDVNQTPTGDQIAQIYDMYEYSLVIDPVTLTAGTTYYVAIFNDVSSWFWATSNDNGTHFRSFDPYTAFGSQGDDMAFNLTNDGVSGVVPEPASILLLGLGLGGVAWRVRKKHN